MKKSDLKTGMFVKFRNCTTGIVNLNVAGGELVTVDRGTVSLDSFKEDLTHNFMQIYDIIKIYDCPKESVLKYGGRLPFAYELIWQRKEIKEMTVKEIEKELGYKIKIVGDEDVK